MLDDDDDSSHRLRIGIVGEEKDRQLCNPILAMTGFGSSPCGACKFLRRKCADGCMFAPYFCHDQGAAHFAAIHKVFGASNVSKLLMQLPLSDRSEASLTISYEAQARLQDPIYGRVSHIFALEQQVVTLEAQLASLLSHCQLGGMEFSLQSEMRMTQPLVSDSCVNHEKLMYHSKGFIDSTSFFSSQDYDHLPHMDAEHISFMMAIHRVPWLHLMDRQAQGEQLILTWRTLTQWHLAILIVHERCAISKRVLNPAT